MGLNFFDKMVRQTLHFMKQLWHLPGNFLEQWLVVERGEQAGRLVVVGIGKHLLAIVRSPSIVQL